MVIHRVVIHPQWNSCDFEWNVEVITTSTGHKLLPPYIRVIQGDGFWLRCVLGIFGIFRKPATQKESQNPPKKQNTCSDSWWYSSRILKDSRIKHSYQAKQARIDLTSTWRFFRLRFARKQVEANLLGGQHEYTQIYTDYSRHHTWTSRMHVIGSLRCGLWICAKDSDLGLVVLSTNHRSNTVK